jgi:hypothetical protein
MSNTNHRFTSSIILLTLLTHIACGGGDPGSDSDTDPGQLSAEISAPERIFELAGVTLRGNGVSAAGARVVEYAWRQLSGPTLAIEGGSTAQPTITAPIVDGPGAAEIELEVVADDGSSATATITIAVQPNAFVYFTTGDRQTTGEELWRVGRQGNRRRLSPPAEPGVAIYTFGASPDRRRIAFERDRASDPALGDVWIVDADGSNLRAVTGAFESRGGSAGPRWSPDSRYLAFQARALATDFHRELYTVAADASEPVRVSHVGTADEYDNAALAAGDTANALVPDGIPDSAMTHADGKPFGVIRRHVWSPQSVLAFVAQVHGSRAELFTVNPDGSELTRRIDIYRDSDGLPGFDYDANFNGTPDVSVSSNVIWSPAGDMVAFSLQSNEGTIGGLVYTSSNGATEPRLRLVQGTGQMMAPRRARSFAFSPDGAYLAVVADRDEDEVFGVYSEELATGTVRVITSPTLDLFPADGNPDSDADADSIPDGDVTYLTGWVDNRRFVFRGDLRRRGVGECFAAHVEQPMSTANDVVSLTDVFSVDWNQDGQPDFSAADPFSSPAGGWRFPMCRVPAGAERVVASGTMVGPDIESIFTVGIDGGDRQLIYTQQPGYQVDDLSLLDPEHAVIIEYRSNPVTGDDSYEARILSVAGGSSRQVVDLEQYDFDGDGWPEYSLDRLACADPGCTAVISLLEPINGHSGEPFVAITDMSTGEVTRVSDLDNLRQYHLVTSGPKP